MHHGWPNDNADLICVCREMGCRAAELCRFGACGARPPSFRAMARGECIYPDERSCMRFRIVRTGLVATCATTPDGRRQILCLNVPGDAVCTMSAKGAECWSEALAPTEICELDFSSRSEQLRMDPGFSGTLFQITHDRLERSALHLVTLGRFDGMERVCGFLADMTRRIGRRRGSGWHLCLSMSREDIADYLGLNADTVTRQLTRIKKAGLARFRSPTECEIPSLERLEARVPIALAREVERSSPHPQEMAS